MRVSGQAFIDLSRQFQCAVFAAKKYGIFPLPPPKAVSVGRILDGQANHERVMVTGIITDVRRDDVDDDWSYCVVKSGGQSLLIAIPEGARGREAASSRLHALCRFTGVVLADHANMRRYLGPHLELESADSIEVVTAAGTIRITGLWYNSPHGETPDHRGRRDDPYTSGNGADGRRV